MSDQRDEEFTSFVEDHSSALLRYCWLLTGTAADAEDLLQSSLLKLYLHWERVDRPGARVRYVKQIAARQHVSVWRKVGRRERPTDRFAEVPTPAVEYDDELWRALQALGERQRTVVVLRYHEGLDEASIAQFMGTSVGTVKSQLSRGLARLRQELAGDVAPLVRPVPAVREGRM